MKALLAVIFAALLAPAAASASGGHYAFVGGSMRERKQVIEALAVSRFDWNIVPKVSVVISRGQDSEASPGTVWLDADLLDAGTFSWAIVQHEFAHELDFSLLDDADRAQLEQALGGSVWLDTQAAHQDQAGERFATMMSVAFWPAYWDNCYYPRPGNRDAENGSVSPAAFRILLTRLLAAKTNQPQ